MSNTTTKKKRTYNKPKSNGKKTAKIKETKNIEKFVSETKETTKQKWECYTFIENVSIWLDVYWIWERVLLTKDDLKEYWPYVVLTSEYKWKSYQSTSKKWCGCKW